MTLFDDVADRSKLHSPFNEAATEACEILDENGQATVFQVFECGHCGVVTQTMEPNTFLEKGRCSECGKVTDLKETGCSFAVFLGPPEEIIPAVADSLCGKPEGQPN